MPKPVHSFLFLLPQEEEGTVGRTNSKKEAGGRMGRAPGGREGRGRKTRQEDLKAEATHVLMPAPRSGRSGSGPCVFTFCDSGCLMKKANPFPAPAHQHHSLFCRSPPGARPRCWHGHSGAGGCIWMCFRAALPQDRLPLASASLCQSGGCS